MTMAAKKTTSPRSWSTVAVSPAVGEAIKRLKARVGADTNIEVVRRAVELYEFMTANADPRSEILIEDVSDGSRRLVVLPLPRPPEA
jgi:hypothetical protein